MRYGLHSILVMCMLLPALAPAQEIEAKLSGNTSAVGLTVKDNLGSNLFRVGGDGNVGVGTLNPSTTFHVEGGGITLSRATFGNPFQLTKDGNAPFGIFEGGTAGVYRLAINNGGVGIGTVNPVGPFVVNNVYPTTRYAVSDVNKAQFGFNSLVANAAEVTTLDADPVILATNSTERMRITGAGNVVIGATSATNRLVVAQNTAGSYAARFYTDNVAAGSSYGLLVSAGTNVNDVAFKVEDQASYEMFSVRGNNAIAGGRNASAVGNEAVALGHNCYANGHYSFALGSYASTNAKDGCFVISDASTQATTAASANNQFVARYDGGYRLYSNAAQTTGVYMNTGQGGWSNISDRNRKQNFTAVDGEWLLGRIRSLPVTQWNYTGTDPSVRYIGPMAQDFWQAFKLGGTDSLGINSINIDGVNFAAVKALEQRTTEDRELIESLREQLAAKDREIIALREQFNADRRENEARYLAMEKVLRHIQEQQNDLRPKQAVLETSGAQK